MDTEQLSLPDREAVKKIQAARDQLGRDLIILAHFYQNDDIIQCADFVGDSLQLAQKASQQKDARYIVFCAVSFMAETARILCLPEQQVFHPEPQAYCPLAAMAAMGDVEESWTMLKETGREIVPVVYVNSNADLKAFCGKNNGFVCTSANAKKVMEYVLSRGAIPFFFPDENLGRNTAHAIGISDEEMFLWDPDREISITDVYGIRDRKVVLWKGFCYVHTNFQVSDVEAIRRAYGHDMKIAVHPECTPEVVGLSDFVGSTSFIKNTVEQAPPGSRWAIGTEIHFVERIKRNNPDKLIVPLGEWECSEMSRVTATKLLNVLLDLIKKRPRSAVTVNHETAKYARIALEKMLEIG